MTTSKIRSTLAGVFAFLVHHASATLNIDFVSVGDAGNAADTTGYGAVSYNYNIAKYEVTLTQYTTFLNAVAATDSCGLYNTNMGTNLNIAGIARTGLSGSYTYAVSGDGNRPVTYVSWFDAARFSNWAQNGQPVGLQLAGTTETGAYTLNGATSGIISKNVGATHWIPTANEWYKAAYYQPAAAGGDGDGYWLYPTKSNSAPGNSIGASTNQANYYAGDFSVTESANYSSTQNYLVAVGSYSGSASHYGTYDQGGNVWEWNDEVILGSTRGVRGGSWDNGYNSIPANNGAAVMQATDNHNNPPTDEVQVLGFRLASVPEPTGAITGLLLLGSALAIRRRSC